MASMSLAHEAAAVFDRAAVFVAALVGEAGVEIGQKVAHEAGDLGAVETGADRAVGGLGVLADAVADIFLGHYPGRAEMRQGLGNVRGLDAIAQVDAAITAGVEDLLDGHRRPVP